MPDDVLCAIFEAYARLDPPSRRSVDGRVVCRLGWIALGHVDRRWRSTLLGLSPLWADIVCVFPKAAHEIIARARDVPLTFEIPFVSDNALRKDLCDLALL